jgi:hypothetical protein
MAISFDNFLPNLIAGAVFLAVCALAVFVIVFLGVYVFRRLKNTHPVVKVLTLVGFVVMLFILGMVLFWLAFLALYHLGGGGPLR